MQGGERDVQGEKKTLGKGACLDNCESRNALIPVPIQGRWWDGMALSHLPGCCPVLLHRMGSHPAGMDHTDTPRALSPASRDRLRPHLQVPVDKWISLPLQDSAAVPPALLSTGAWSALGSACFAAATLPSLAGMRAKRIS